MKWFCFVFLKKDDLAPEAGSIVFFNSFIQICSSTVNISYISHFRVELKYKKIEWNYFNLGEQTEASLEVPCQFSFLFSFFFVLFYHFPLE